MTALPARLRRCVAAVRAMEAAATPGPWSTGTPGPNRCPTIGTRGGLMVAMVAYGEDHPTESNARLIVAARNTLAAQLACMEAMADLLNQPDNVFPHRDGDGAYDVCYDWCKRCKTESSATAWCEAVEREYGVAEQRESEEAR